MKSGYDQFFKNARKVADSGGGANARSNTSSARSGQRLSLDVSSEDIESQIRRRMSLPSQKPKRKKTKIPWKMMVFSALGLVTALWGLENHSEVERMIKRVEVTYTGEALAEDIKSESASRSTAKAEGGGRSEEGKASEKGEGSATNSERKLAFSDDEIDHLSKLNDRKKELDAREEELNRQEAELQNQKAELDKRLKDLEEMRGKISSILEDRVKADDQKVDTLVQMYSNMKPPQAAKVFETMDEDLVVEILGRMKKKNAADIMNLLKPEKAQIISEKYAGYKRR